MTKWCVMLEGGWAWGLGSARADGYRKDGKVAKA